MSAAGLLLLGALAFTGFAGLTAALMAVTRRVWRPRIDAMEPARRARALAVAAAGPLLSGLGLTALCFAPKLLGAVVPSADHCTTHGAGHAHFCLSHLPATPGTALAWAVLIGALAVLVAPALAHALRALRSRRSLAALLAGAEPGPREGIHVVPLPLPLAMSAGVLRRRILVSRGLLDALDPALLGAVIAHERAHHRRRDVLLALVATLAASLHVPSTRRELLASLELAMEQASDEEAAAQLGDRLLVARALLAVERLAHSWPTPALLGARMGGSTVPRRVEALLSPPVSAGARLPAALVAGLLLLAAALVADPLHHTAETLLGFIAGM